MSWEILATTDYPAIRAALDVDLLPANLPDSTIGLTIYKNAAIQDVYNAYKAAGSSNDPASEVDPGRQARITRAAIYFCAARLAPAVVRITSLNTQTRDMSYSRQTFDPEARAAELKAMAEAELAPILTPNETIPNRPTMFAVATGCRGR